MHKAALRGFEFRCVIRDDTYFQREHIFLQTIEQELGVDLLTLNLHKQFIAAVIGIFDPQGSAYRTAVHEHFTEICKYLMPWIKLDAAKLSQADVASAVEAWKRAYPEASVELIEQEAARMAELVTNPRVDDWIKVI